VACHGGDAVENYHLSKQTLSNWHLRLLTKILNT
jgi:hypothetical protein